MREFEISNTLQKILKKLLKKDKKRYESLLKKIQEIIESPNPDHYKNLRYGMKEFKRVHVDSHFVLVFRFLNGKLYFDDFEHHDNIY